MKRPEIPANESDRQAALDRYKILDTLPEQVYDDLTQLAADICGTPIALISLVDKERQWFKSRVGVDVSETPRDISFCGHAVAANAILNVPDASLDPRFADNPLVAIDPNIRFYAGVPLITDDGYALGTLCVIDRQPRDLTEQQIRQLEALSRLVISQFELRLKEEAFRLLASVVESSNDAIITKTLEGIITSWNPAAEKLFGYSEAEAIGHPISILFPPDRLDEEPQILARLRRGERAEHFETVRISKEGKSIEVSATISPLVNDAGEMVGVSKILRDISDLKQAEQALQQLNQSLEEKVTERTQELLQVNQLFQTVLDAFPLSVFWKDRQSVVLGCNQLFAMTCGLKSPLEAIGKSDFDFACNEDEALAYIADDRQVMESGLAKLNIEENITLASGEQLWLQTNKVPLRDLEGNVIGVMGTFQDISDRKQAELALAQKEQQFQELANASPSVIYSIVQALNGAPYFEYLSPAAEKIHELAVAEAYQNSAIIFEQMHPDDLQGYGDAIKQSLKTLQPFSHEWRIITNSGTKWLRGNSLPSRRKNGDVVWHGVVTEISDRKQVELELQKTTERLALALKSGAIGYWEWDLQQNIGFWDDRMYELYGLCKETDSQIVCEIWANSIHPDDRAANEMILQQIATGQIDEYDTEFRVVYPDGSIHFNKAYGTLKRDANGNPLSVTGINFDISDRKQAEKALKESEQSYASLMAAAPVGIFRTDAMGHCTYVNDHWCRISGLTLESAIGDGWRQGLYSEDRQSISDEWYRSAQEDRPFSLEYRFQRPDGVITWVYGQSVVKLDADGIVTGYVGTITDINDRKQAEIALQSSEDRFRRMFDSSVVGMLFANFQGHITDANDRFLEMVGYTRDDFQSGAIDWLAMTPPEYIEQDYASMKYLLKHRQIDPWEKEYYRKDGSRISILIGAALLQDKNNETICVILDISDRKQSETKLQLANEELMRATRLKDEFLANMSHELRTPLNSILGMNEVLQEEVFGSINERQLKALQTIESSSRHLLALINDILDVAKIESGEVMLELTATDIDSLCKSSIAFIKQQALTKRIQLIHRIPKYLPEIMIDERRIRQVLINLLNNAVKFTLEGGTITLEVSQVQLESSTTNLTPLHYLKIAVIDTGIGISAENIQKLFQPFIQIDSALNRQYTGTGLGLALVKRLVELHGGNVELTSELGVGSCFAINLPFNIGSPAIEEQTEDLSGQSQIGQSQTEELISPLILLAEDNEANIATFSSYLDAKGYRILLATDGQQAIDIAKSHSPDLILMDIQMPVMDGLEAIAQIRLDPNLVDIPIVALTALAMEGDRERCLAAGANEYLTKPVKLKQLATSIQQFLMQRKNNV